MIISVLLKLLFTYYQVRNFINYEGGGGSVATELFVFTIRCKRKFDGFSAQQSNVVTN